MDDHQTKRGTLVGRLDRSFPWGLLLVTDEGSTDPVPDFRTPGDAVASGRTCVVVSIEHEQFGPAVVHVFEGAGDLSGTPAFDGIIESASGVITVGDALGTSIIRVEASQGSRRLQIHVDRAMEATHVDVVFRPPAPG